MGRSRGKLGLQKSVSSIFEGASMPDDVQVAATATREMAATGTVLAESPGTAAKEQEVALPLGAESVAEPLAPATWHVPVQGGGLYEPEPQEPEPESEPAIEDLKLCEMDWQEPTPEAEDAAPQESDDRPAEGQGSTALVEEPATDADPGLQRAKRETSCDKGYACCAPGAEPCKTALGGRFVQCAYPKNNTCIHRFLFLRKAFCKCAVRHYLAQRAAKSEE